MACMTEDIWTLQKLAALISKIAGENDRRFDSLETRFAALDQKIEREIGGLAATVKSGFDELHERMDGLDGRQQGFQNRLDAFLNHDRRLRRVEKELGIQAVE